jgi:hypothetical protein
MAIEIHPHAATRRHQQSFTLAGFFDAVAFLGSEPEAGRAISNSSRGSICPNHLRCRYALNRASDARAESVAHPLGQHVDLEPEVPAAPHQVAQGACAEIVLGHRDSLVDDERSAPRTR